MWGGAFCRMIDLIVTRKRDATDVVDRVRQIWDGVPGFELSSFNAYVECEHDGNDLWLSFHYQPLGVMSLIQLHREPTSAWARRLGKQLRRAGYDRKYATDDEVAYDRWLRGERQYGAELRRLGELAAGDDLSTWPKRKVTPEPKQPPRQRAQSCAEVMALVRALGAPWEVSTFLYTRSIALETIAPVGFAANLTAVAIFGDSVRSRMVVLVSIRGPSGMVTDPDHEAVKLMRRCVRRTGLRFDAEAGSFSHKKTVRAEAALKMCTTIIERLEKHTQR